MEESFSMGNIQLEKIWLNLLEQTVKAEAVKSIAEQMEGFYKFVLPS